MINREEVLEFAREFQLEPNVVEKDYALGWLLAGIGNHPVLRDAWVFKGGTCLKKCFFETYRFSEDLDFTVRDPAHLDVGFLSGTFAEIAEWVYRRFGYSKCRVKRISSRFSTIPEESLQRKGASAIAGRWAVSAIPLA